MDWTPIVIAVSYAVAGLIVGLVIAWLVMKGWDIINGK